MRLKTEADRARRLASTVHDTRLARELTAYAAELERSLALQPPERAQRTHIELMQ
jgi:hypothetical protein